MSVYAAVQNVDSSSMSMRNYGISSELVRWK